MTADSQGVGQHNAGGYAHDAAIVTKSPTSMNHFLNDILALFCDFTGIEVHLQYRFQEKITTHQRYSQEITQDAKAHNNVNYILFCCKGTQQCKIHLTLLQRHTITRYI